ncbi:PIN-like domain-containing protein [Paraburkholderia terrae]|uniref:PIN like domain-containing protein n=1 Tax=Paraburkholderia terrae TaxID=311230 RepID=A0A2I8ELF5_9BURK|nr:PIN-like domain-containing protein [Paraburkholderia terrae]AUT60222.1 hypothetical protein C2L65_11865 [Paraburkholderia terrae]
MYQYEYSEEFEKQIWKDCIFAFDTSALLELYFYSEISREKLFSNVLHTLEGRLWIPGHAEFEYRKNRKKAITNPISEKYKPLISEDLKTLRNMSKALGDKIKDVSQKTRKEHTHPYLNQSILRPICAASELFKAEMERFHSSAESEINLRIAEIEAMEMSDPVLNRISGTFSFGKNYTFSRKMEILAESELRFRSHIPPGYLDAEGKNAKEGLQKIGDLVIWNQIIDHAIETGLPIVFVTNDVKLDWCHIKKHSNEVRIERPREELIQEIGEKASARFWMYSFPQFLYACKRELHVSIDDAVMKEAEAVASEAAPKGLGKLRFDGIYRGLSDDGSYSQYMRFFPDGQVIGVSVSGDYSEKILKWFKYGYEDNGMFQWDGKDIVFALSSNMGKVDYLGEILEDHLILNSHSHINGRKLEGKIYNFIPVS